MIYLWMDELVFVWSTLDLGVEIMKCLSYTVDARLVIPYLTDGEEVVWIPVNVKLPETYDYNDYYYICKIVHIYIYIYIYI